MIGFCSGVFNRRMCLSALEISKGIDQDGHTHQRMTTHPDGTSRTKIHLTLKIPFHLSWAQTLLVCVSSTLNVNQHTSPAIKERNYGVSICATPQKWREPLTEKKRYIGSLSAVSRKAASRRLFPSTVDDQISCFSDFCTSSSCGSVSPSGMECRSYLPCKI